MNENKIVYLAVPYSHPNKEKREERFNKVNEVAARLMSQGELVYSPISHTHPIAEAGDLPKDWNYWQNYDRAFLNVSKKLVVLRLPGWEESKGVAGEVEIAKNLNIPVEYIDYKEKAVKKYLLHITHGQNVYQNCLSLLIGHTRKGKASTEIILNDFVNSVLSSIQKFNEITTSPCCVNSQKNGFEYCSVCGEKLNISLKEEAIDEFSNIFYGNNYDVKLLDDDLYQQNFYMVDLNLNEWKDAKVIKIHGLENLFR